MKSKIVVPPTEIFQKENLTPDDIGEELNIETMSSGADDKKK